MKNTTGTGNTASGYKALYGSLNGSYNTASGYQALSNNGAGGQNSAFGWNALHIARGGLSNTAVGVDALSNLTGGTSNLALGAGAGSSLDDGLSNIYIANRGSANDSYQIRIGTQGEQTNTFIAGIYNNTTVSGLAVVVDSNGQLGVSGASSERIKTDVHPMGPNSDMLGKLKPVTFRYKSDPHATLQYGLIAEEVAKVYPELIIRDATGRIDGVRYDELAPMLLNEMQKRDSAREAKIAAQDAKISQLMGQLAEMHTALAELRRQSKLVAQR